MFLVKLLSVKNLQLYLVGGLIVFGAFYYNKAKTEKEIRKIEQNNASNSRRWILDSVNLVQQYLSQKEINNYLESSNKALGEKLKQDNIKFNRITQIINQKKQYIDTSKYKKDLSVIVDGIKKGVVSKAVFEKENECLITKGYVFFDGDSLSVNIDYQKYKGISDYVTYTRREKHRWLLGIKTNVFGKKVSSVKIYDKCGNSKLIVLDKNK